MAQWVKRLSFLHLYTTHVTISDPGLEVFRVQIRQVFQTSRKPNIRNRQMLKRAADNLEKRMF